LDIASISSIGGRLTSVSHSDAPRDACSFTGPILSASVPFLAEALVKRFAKTLVECKTKEDAVRVIRLFVERVTENKHTFPCAAALLADGHHGFDVDGFVKDLSSRLSTSESTFEVLNAIHHLLPDTLRKETERTTRVITEHQLRGLSSKDLSGSAKRKRGVDKLGTHHSESSDDENDDEPIVAAPPAGKRRSTRVSFQEPSAAVMTMHQPDSVALHTLRAEVLFLRNLALQQPPAAGSYFPGVVPHPQQPLHVPLACVASIEDHSNKNTYNSRFTRPWKDPDWKGCRRCWTAGHYPSICPPVLAGVLYCRFCLQDGHVLGPSCPAMKAIRCTKCNKNGHQIAFCPDQTCTLCGVLGHGPASRMCQKK
jgi:hypothetical protein